MIRFYAIVVLLLSLLSQAAFGTIYLDKSEVFVDLLKNSNFHGLNYQKPVRNLHFTTIQDQRVYLRQLRGKLVILTFWTINATDWPSEMESLETLLSKHSGAGLEIIALNLVDPIDKIKFFLRNHPTNLSIAFDTDKSFSVSRRKFAGDSASYFVTDNKNEALFEIPRFPTSYLIDQNGLVVGFFSGKTKWNSKELDRFCASMLDSNHPRIAKEADFQYDARQGIGLPPQAPPVTAGPSKKGPVQAPLGPQAPIPESVESPEKNTRSLPLQPSVESPPQNEGGQNKSLPSKNEDLKSLPTAGGEIDENIPTPSTRKKKKTGSGTALQKDPQTQHNRLKRGSSTTAPSVIPEERQAAPINGPSPVPKINRRTSTPPATKSQTPLPVARPYYPTSTRVPSTGSDVPIRGLNNPTEKRNHLDPVSSVYSQSGSSELPAAQPLPNRNLIGGSILDSFSDPQNRTSALKSTESRDSQTENQPTNIFEQIGQDVLSLGEGIRGSFSKLFGNR
ncbi:MAG: redoxin domain-containing protein [Pseudomonadota bacterium]